MNFKKCVIGQPYKAKFKQVHSDDELQDIELIFDGETEVLGAYGRKENLTKGYIFHYNKEDGSVQELLFTDFVMSFVGDKSYYLSIYNGYVDGNEYLFN